MLDIIAPASLMAQTQHFQTHVEWIRNTSARMYASGNLEAPWNGQIKGKAVKACIDSSRWVSFCPYCNHAEAVDPVEKVFFCFNCNMLDNDHEALPVEFPEAKLMNEIIAVLMERPMKQVGGPTRYERIARMQPMIVIVKGDRRYGLSRSWHWSQSVEDLHLEQDEAILQWKEKVN